MRCLGDMRARPAATSRTGHNIKRSVAAQHILDQYILYLAKKKVKVVKWLDKQEVHTRTLYMEKRVGVMNAGASKP